MNHSPQLLTTTTQLTSNTTIKGKKNRGALAYTESECNKADWKEMDAFIKEIIMSSYEESQENFVSY